ncbi:MAG: Gfo/Idh/MocA family oxidoreductase [Bacteroidales bacterium]|nr:Gfo/Idh/MocA family oxidoreductase [Bacteroidales bacterium]
MEKVNWGIIGCGNVTEVKSGPAFYKAENSALVAVMRRDAAKAADYAHRHGVPAWYSNADELIADKKVNAVYIATPPDTHAAYAIKALRAGKPVYVEKPMALNYSECRQMLAVSEDTGVPIFVAYYRRMLPGFLRVKQLIDSGAIGKPLSVALKLIKPPSNDELNGNLPWRVLPEVAGAGHFFDLASHQLDYLDYLFGPVVRVKGIASNRGGLYAAEDTLAAVFEFKNGVVGSGEWCFVASSDTNTDQIEITGENGNINFSCYSFSPIQLMTDGNRQVFRNERPGHVQFYLVQEIVNELLGKGKSPSTGETGARTSWVMGEVVKEYYKK